MKATMREMPESKTAQNKLYKQWNHNNNNTYNFDSPVSQKSKGFLGNKRSIQDMRNYYTVYNPKD